MHGSNGWSAITTAAPEVWLRLLNKNAPEAGISYSEAVEIALCFGWIDSLTRKYDAVSRIQRFTPAQAAQRVVEAQC